jgi:uncharacterized UPF0146 family protein
VEVGIGLEKAVYNELSKNSDCEVIAVDLVPGKGVLKDDFIMSDFSIYEGADLIYSIRPPPEIVYYLQKMAKRLGCDLLIRPFSNDGCSKPKNMALLNVGKAVLWLEKI